MTCFGGFPDFHFLFPGRLDLYFLEDSSTIVATLLQPGNSHEMQVGISSPFINSKQLDVILSEYIIYIYIYIHTYIHTYIYYTFR